MKYIRTKDGRILDLNRIKLYAESYSFNNESETHLSIEWDIIREEIDILKQADTIEELCDNFVTISIGFHRNYIKFSLKEALQRREWLKRLGYASNIYGAVWTNEGLIYVAKINDKGDLVLL